MNARQRHLEVNRAGWVSDIHLNFVDLRQWDRFIEQLSAADLDVLLITGDISEADDVTYQLDRLLREFSGAIFFVLGNHDFYHGTVATVRRDVAVLSSQRPRLHYLTADAPSFLSSTWAVCGDDGWADTRIGDYYQSPVRMNDFRLIHDLCELDPVARRRWLRREGAASALRLSRQLRHVAPQAQRILVLTHVPPFRQSCWYEGRHTDDAWAPFFTCHAVGWVLRRFCLTHPEHEVLVLCGHTHHAGRSQIAHNLVVWTAAAEYAAPKLADVIDLAAFNYPPNDWNYAE